MKLLLPYVQLAFIGWVVVSANPPQWQVVATVLLLAWLALGITALRVALAALTRAFISQTETTKLLRGLMPTTRLTKPRRRFL